MGYAVREDGKGWRAVNNEGDCAGGEFFSETQPAYKELSKSELTAQAFELVRTKLQSEIDKKAKALGFSNGNALMLYAGFSNGFQSLADAFAKWEASVWIQAGHYRDEVLAGNKPIITPTEAAAIMPDLVLPS